MDCTDSAPKCKEETLHVIGKAVLIRLLMLMDRKLFVRKSWRSFKIELRMPAVSSFFQEGACRPS